MQAISFCGLLSINDKKNFQTINTDHIVRLAENQEKGGVDMTLSAGEPLYFSYPYAEMQKAFINAHKNGYYEYKPGSDSLTMENAAKIQANQPKKTSDTNNEAEIKQIFDAKKTNGKNAFELLPKEIQERYGQKICPNSLQDINRYLRTNREDNLTDLDIDIINAVDAAMAKIDGIEKDTTFYRAVYGIHLDANILNAEIGDAIVPDKGYAQVVCSENAIEKYVPGENCDPVVFEIRCKKGSKVCEVPDRMTGSGHKEAMMPRGAKYKIIDKRENAKIEYSYPVWDNGIETKTKPVLKYTLEYIDE